MSDFRSTFRFEMGLRFGMLARRKTVRWADHHERMSAHWVEQAQRCGRPPYREAGHEKPYGYPTRSMWRYVWMAMREAFKAAWHEEMDDSYSYDPAPHAIITGLTS
jgi:hypothetical protein